MSDVRHSRQQSKAALLKQDGGMELQAVGTSSEWDNPLFATPSESIPGSPKSEMSPKRSSGSPPVRSYTENVMFPKLNAKEMCMIYCIAAG